MHSKSNIYPFYNANIHEDRFIARVCRSLPFAFFIAICLIVSVGAFRQTLILLIMCAIMNVSLWLWLVSTCLCGIIGTFLVHWELHKVHTDDRRLFKGQTPPLGSALIHVIVIPNYKEDQKLLEETLESLSEAEDARLFHIVLAMEAREMGSEAKGTKLKSKFKDHFARIDVTLHPDNQVQIHNDRTVSSEVPGKASNLRWAMKQVHTNLSKDGTLSLDDIMVTVADADCIFHPSYFAKISKEFNIMREKPGNDQEHKWTMWQAPQLSYRNHWVAPVCSRTWTYISSMYEFGGVTSLHFGGHQMVFSAYSLPLLLACQAESWDGDVVAEDHHCYLKSYFYALHATASSDSISCRPRVRVRPIFLPVKSTAVLSSDGYWRTYVERWHQAKRHAQGVAELSYTLLATFDALCSLPLKAYSFSLLYGLSNIILRLFCMNLLPLCQTVGLGAMTFVWLYKDRLLPYCPETLTLTMMLESEYILCGLAGTWTLIWPVVVPILCLIVANFLFVSSSFINPAKHSKKIWYKEDGDFGVCCGSRKCMVFLLTLSDCVFFLVIMMMPYGLVVVFLGLWRVAFFGNNITYVTAAKRTKAMDTPGKDEQSTESQ